MIDIDQYIENDNLVQKLCQKAADAGIVMLGYEHAGMTKEEIIADFEKMIAKHQATKEKKSKK